MFNDEAIIGQIRTTLDEDPRIPHPDEVAVSEQNGTVTLRGTVRSFHQRQAALQIAKSARRVRFVVDELRVDPRDHWRDEEIRGLALQALMSDTAVPADRVDVVVADGWLTLKGEVEHQYDSNAAFDAVSAVPGVGGITNVIKVITAGIDG